jgi:hypothetical protein
MKSFKSRTGPFARQPFYESAELETICNDELLKLNLLPSEPSPIRIDRFIEKRFVAPRYEELPPRILGFTKFGANGVEEIVIAKAFDQEGTKPSERRLRSTLAHEGGHGLLHAHLFALDASPRSLFGDGLASDSPKLMCRDEGIAGTNLTGEKPPYRWWEFQANQAMGALLLPRLLVEKALATTLVSQGVFGVQALPNNRRDAAVLLVAETFDVNPVVARIRLESMYPLSGQLHL